MYRLAKAGLLAGAEVDAAVRTITVRFRRCRDSKKRDWRGPGRKESGKAER